MISQADLQLAKILWDYHCRLDQLPDLISSGKFPAALLRSTLK
jgi:hypothetical protein